MAANFGGRFRLAGAGWRGVRGGRVSWRSGDVGPWKVLRQAQDERVRGVELLRARAAEPAAVLDFARTERAGRVKLLRKAQSLAELPRRRAVLRQAQDERVRGVELL
jgi:hypothetical protein